MNLTNIPRYKASMPLQNQFVTNADSCGDHVFTCLERSGSFAVYRRNNVEDNRVSGFEVVTIKVVPAGTLFSKGATPTETDYESYPGKSSFGKSAWFCATEKRAFEKFDELQFGH